MGKPVPDVAVAEVSLKQLLNMPRNTHPERLTK
jgi:hypothetical protein